MLTSILVPRDRPDLAVAPHLSMDIEPKPEEVGRVRRAVNSFLVRFGPGPCTDDVLLVASELVTNAVRHAPCPSIRLRITRGDGLLLIEVEDGSAAPPVLRCHSDVGAESGRGLGLVHALAVEWGWTPREDGTKSTWAVLSLPARDNESSPHHSARRKKR